MSLARNAMGWSVVATFTGHTHFCLFFGVFGGFFGVFLFFFLVFFLLLKQFFHRHQCFMRTFSRNSSPIPSPTEGVGVDRAMT